MRFNQLVPELSVSDIENSKRFYTDVLGFRIEYERVEDKFVFLSLGEAQLMINEINGHWETGKLEYPLGRGINVVEKYPSMPLFIGLMPTGTGDDRFSASRKTG